MYLIAIATLIVFFFALPGVYRNGWSWKRLGWAFFVSLFGIVLPLFVFFFSAFLTPDWKGACKYGWVNCFHMGKLALTPIVLWATGAMYFWEFRLVPKANFLIASGFFIGALVATVCLVFGVVVNYPRTDLEGWLLVPLYVSVWHWMRAWEVQREVKAKLWGYFLVALSSAPFWVFSVIWSRRFYESLPANPPSCFIVTAASLGHARVVGPFFGLRRRGTMQRVNRQLATFWQLEELWSVNSAASHALFRKIYNRLGPVIARRIVRPWIADATYLLLKPFEWLAAFVLALDTRLRSPQ